MGKYIDWYLVEVERRLGGSVDRESLHETLIEVEGHLMAAKEAAMERGLEEAASELAAIEAFGSARRLVTSSVRANPRSIHIALHVLAGLLASGGIALLAASLVTHTQAWPLILVGLLVAFALVSALATRPLRWQVVGLMVAVSTLIQIVGGGIAHAPFAGPSGSSFIARSEAAAIVDGTRVPRRTLSGAIHPRENDLLPRARAALQKSYGESMTYLAPQIAVFNCFVLGGLLALHFSGFGAGLFLRRLGRRRLLA